MVTAALGLRKQVLEVYKGCHQDDTAHLGINECPKGLYLERGGRTYVVIYFAYIPASL